MIETILTLVIMHRSSKAEFSGQMNAENSAGTGGVDNFSKANPSGNVADRSLDGSLEDLGESRGRAVGISWADSPPELEAHAAYYSPRRTDGFRALPTGPKTEHAGMQRFGNKCTGWGVQNAEGVTSDLVNSPIARHVHVLPRVDEERTKFSVLKTNFIGKLFVISG